MNRTLEATAQPEDVPWLWRQYAFRGYLRCSASTSRCSRDGCRRQVFYNLMIAGRKRALSWRGTAASRDSSRSATASPSARARWSSA